MKRKYIIAVLLIITVIFLLNHLLSYRTTSFKDITGVTIENADKIMIGDKIIYDNFDEIISFFASYEYKRIHNNSFDFQEEFPNGLRTYLIFIYLNNGKIIFINPMKNRVIINNRLYKVNKEMDHDFLIDIYESISEDNIIEN